MEIDVTDFSYDSYESNESNELNELMESKPRRVRMTAGRPGTKRKTIVSKSTSKTVTEK